jgi:imidazole glycerol phosphate synthase subunit HisF
MGPMSVIKIMPCLDTKNSLLVNGVYFVDIRDASDPWRKPPSVRK